MEDGLESGERQLPSVQETSVGMLVGMQSQLVSICTKGESRLMFTTLFVELGMKHHRTFFWTVSLPWTIRGNPPSDFTPAAGDRRTLEPGVMRSLIRSMVNKVVSLLPSYGVYGF